ncbi:MAG: phenylalanine--tRNA ligase subunit beta [Pedobacter sp.]|nr:phenylalanine--tRNA ligase subunit beta [Pedobacter sp.]
MKISYNWLKQFINITQSADELSLILTNIGLEVESLEKVQAVIGGLQDLVIGEVITCVPHQNADKLNITTVNLGTENPFQIVCGAPNVAAGQKVVVAPVGCTIYPLSGEPFKIKEAKIRGELSYGMICAEDEIGLGKSHDGIMVLPAEAKVGMLAKDFFDLEDDYVFEIGLTPNRADAASHLGVARDLAAYFRSAHKIPDISTFNVDDESLTISVAVEDDIACPRYSSITLSGICVKESPAWLQDRLKIIGLRPINNVVDVTNFVLHGFGQPLHAFDAAKITGGKVVVKKVAEGTFFTTLDGIERKLSAEDLMICNGGEHIESAEPMCIAGVFGGKTSGVDGDTTTIFLESAYFNAVSVRKTSKRHGLKTDASFRYERGTDPNITVDALKFAAMLIKELAGGKISSAISDIYPTVIKDFEFEVKYKNINNLIGIDIPTDEIKDIIVALGIGASEVDEETLILHVPPYKVDVTREVDITEEVLRIYGYNNIPIPTKINASLGYGIKPDKENTNNTVADLLSANGFAEIMCNSLTKPAYTKNVDAAVRILNPLSNDLSVMRQSLLMPALESVAYNQNRRNPNLKFFEFGKTYQVKNDGYVEKQRLLLLITGNKEAEQWNQDSKGSSFYNLKSAVDGLLSRLGVASFQTDTLKDEEFLYGLKYFRGEQILVKFGTATQRDRKLAGVHAEVFYADFDWDVLLKIIKKNKIINKEVNKFPQVRRDLSLLIDKNITFEVLKTIAFKTDKKFIKEVGVFDVYEGNKLPEGKKSYALYFILQDEGQTLSDKQIELLMQKLIGNFEQQAGAEIRK